MKKILIAGASGYLGRHLVNEAKKRGYWVRALLRRGPEPDMFEIQPDEVFHGEATKAETLEGLCDEIDCVISSLGITRQKDGLTYMDVDFQANANVLLEAEKIGVKKFIYVSVLNGEKLTKLKICAAKEKFVSALKKSGTDYCVIRPNGFFSDLAEFYEMAKKGRIYLFGNGEYRTNPIHGADLAVVCIDQIESSAKEVPVGGPETLTHHQIAEIAFSVTGKKPKITRIPLWINNVALALMRFFTGSRIYGPIEFFMTVLSMDFLSPEYGTRTLKRFYEELD